MHCLAECTFVILGSTGDLSRRKLLPAIYRLVADQKLCKFAIVGVASSPQNTKEVLDRAREFINDLDEAIFKKLSDAFYYSQMDFYSNDSYARLNELLLKVEEQHGLPGNRVFYLATMPEHFATITKNFAANGIIGKATGNKDSEPWSRVVYEKPFGFDLNSAKQINSLIASAFDETQAFRIDHYLGKELVSNIAIVRFTNRIFELLWNKENIDSVQIILNESIGLEGRGAFFDAYGTLKDVVQNHALQILALVAMEAPELLVADNIRDAKAAVLRRVHVESVLLGQYDGYLQEPKIKPNSTTETFVALKLVIDNDRWRGVPFYIKAGKYLDETESSIHIKFKKAECRLKLCPLPENYLTIKIQPDEGMFLELNVKTPGSTDLVQPVKMLFSHSSEFGPNTPEAYEVLLLDVVKGDQSAFVRFDEIELSWKVIAQVLANKKVLYSYAKGSQGPKELNDWCEKENLRWRA